jgi:tetratricopeptide (TPR) repeat protein
MNIASCYK